MTGTARLDYDTPDATAVRQQLADEEDPDPIRILLTHRPDPVLDLEPNSGVDLVVAGHTHGGQVVLPVIGPLITMSQVPRDVARGGLNDVNGNQIVVSPGVGLERGQAPQLRFMRPPAVVIIDIEASG